MDRKGKSIWILGILAVLSFCFVATASAVYSTERINVPEEIAEQVEDFLKQIEKNRSIVESEYSSGLYADDVYYYLIVPNKSGKIDISQYFAKDGHFAENSSSTSIESFLEKTENESDEFGYCVVAFQRKQINESTVKQIQTEFDNAVEQQGKAILIFLVIVVLIVLLLINPWYAVGAIMLIVYAYAFYTILRMLGIGI